MKYAISYINDNIFTEQLVFNESIESIIQFITSLFDKLRANISSFFSQKGKVAAGLMELEGISKKIKNSEKLEGNTRFNMITFATDTDKAGSPNVNLANRIKEIFDERRNIVQRWVDGNPEHVTTDMINTTPDYGDIFNMIVVSRNNTGKDTVFDDGDTKIADRKVFDFSIENFDDFLSTRILFIREIQNQSLSCINQCKVFQNEMVKAIKAVEIKNGDDRNKKQILDLVKRACKVTNDDIKTCYQICIEIINELKAVYKSLYTGGSPSNIDKYIDTERDDVKRGNIAVDIFYNKINLDQINALCANERIRKDFFGRLDRFIIDKKYWTKDYLNYLMCACVAECFNKEYLLYMYEVRQYLNKHPLQAKKQIDYKSAIGKEEETVKEGTYMGIFNKLYIL